LFQRLVSHYTETHFYILFLALALLSYNRQLEICPLTNFSPPTHFPLLRSPLPPFLLLCPRLSPPPTLVHSLSPHRHPSLCYMPPSSRFIHYNKRKIFTDPDPRSQEFYFPHTRTNWGCHSVKIEISQHMTTTS
jgi:hypothetical protein